jgi:hypothetical protein
MARQNILEGRDSGWRDLAWAGGAAAAVTLVLVAGVVIVWLLGRTPATPPALGSIVTPTPTPRALSFGQLTAIAEESEAPAVDPVERGAAAGGDAAVSPTPELLAMAAGDEASSSGGILAAPEDVAFTALANGSWTASGDLLRSDGSTAFAEPWLKLATVPTPAFAVEAEMRVASVLETVCDQSFGLVGGSPASGTVVGGGLLFPCDGGSALARLTNVGEWEDGYNGDTVLAEEAFDPGEDWHTYRFEVRGDQIRLLVDGVGLVTTEPDTPLDPEATDREAGIWAQGVGVEVRRVVVVTLPAT